MSLGFSRIAVEEAATPGPQIIRVIFNLSVFLGSTIQKFVFNQGFSLWGFRSTAQGLPQLSLELALTEVYGLGSRVLGFKV